MIIWAILIFWAPGVRPNHNGENVSLQTFQLGDDVTIKCFSIKSFGNTMVWYKQSIGKIPRPIAISYNYLKNIEFEDKFKNGRFNISASEGSFHLNITAMTKEDIGIYYCGTVFLNQIKFISGAYLMLKGSESKDFNMACGERPVVNGTTFKNTDNNNQKAWDPVLLCLISSNVVFVIVIITLLVDHCKRWGKRHKGSTNLTSPSCEIRDSDVNYAAVSFASAPPARRSNNRHLAEYSEVNYKSTDHMI
ncbi:uncharacterized protein LOC127515215 [Ctenopharyngodon idella]|uniref:uncharacterized protein LOC127515215 n=1 Tax=Ctenopharyngodon idella TaxID=7959 RepID=UPI00223255D2|nr:uncharacterized protein LOC127515215 [Ctenopharyngodon idella]